MTTTRHLVLAIAAAACAASAAAAPAASTPASDVVTIDQNKALNGAITANDTAGFPITISTSGSYKLTSNLVVPAGVDGIQVWASNVTIDLNGFSITGPASCGGQSPSSIVCTATTTRGINSAGGNIFRLAVRNGSVGGFGTCVDARYVSRIADLMLHDCDTGIVAFDGSMLSQVSLHRMALAGSVSGATVNGMDMDFVRSGLATGSSALRGITTINTYQAFNYSGGGSNSALSLSSINATVLGSGVQSVGANLCNGAAC